MIVCLWCLYKIKIIIIYFNESFYKSQNYLYKNISKTLTGYEIHISHISSDHLNSAIYPVSHTFTHNR